MTAPDAPAPGGERSARSDGRRVLSIVVPMLNEADNVEALHEKLADVAVRLDREIEIVFVDDGSTDETFEKIAAMRAKDPRVRGLKFSRNFGSHGACLAGFTYCTGDHAAILAADLQDPPELLSDMLAAADEGYEVVWASREGRDDPWTTVVFSNLYNRLMRQIALPNFPLKGFDFVLVSRKVLRTLTTRPERNTSLFGQILWAGFRQKSVPYTRLRRRSGRSKWTFGKKLKLAVDSFVGFSYFPIRLISLLGLTSATLGILYAAVVVARRLMDAVPIEGWSSLMVVSLLLGGTQLVMLGVMGEYLWRALDETRGRPPYIVADTVGVTEPTAQSATSKREP